MASSGRYAGTSLLREKWEISLYSDCSHMLQLFPISPAISIAVPQAVAQQQRPTAMNGWALALQDCPHTIVAPPLQLSRLLLTLRCVAAAYFARCCCFVAQVALSTCDSNEAVQVASRKRRKRPLQATVTRGDGGGGRGWQVWTRLAQQQGKAGRCQVQHCGRSSSVGSCV